MSLHSRAASGEDGRRMDSEARAGQGAPAQNSDTPSRPRGAHGDADRKPAETQSEIDSERAAPHERQAVVWGVPTAVERGETFTIKLGVKCAAGCKPRGWQIEIRDHDGLVVASGLIGNAPWPGTALYYTDVTLTAPDAEGLFAWHAAAPSSPVQSHVENEHVRDSGRERANEHVRANVQVRESGHERSNDHNREREHEPVHAQLHEHEAVRAAFNVRVSPPAECRLTVVAVDRETRRPIERAKVVIHPYRALTDERGVAVLRVPSGPYRLFVSGRDYFPFRRDEVASGDTTVYAELETDTAPSDEELWS